MKRARFYKRGLLYSTLHLKSDLIRGVVLGERHYKRSGLRGERHYKRSGLRGERHYKRSGLRGERHYKRGDYCNTILVV